MRYARRSSVSNGGRPMKSGLVPKSEGALSDTLDGGHVELVLHHSRPTDNCSPEKLVGPFADFEVHEIYLLVATTEGRVEGGQKLNLLQRLCR